MSWKRFEKWLLSHQNPTHVLARLFEVSQEFPKGEINSLFRQQLERQTSEIGSNEALRQVTELAGFDYVGYIARSLRNAGFPDDQIDPLTQDVVVRLLVKPGQLIAGWDGNSPLMARFKTSVKNATINLAQQRRTRRRSIPAMSLSGDEEAAMDIPAPQPQSETLIQAFREFLREKHGQPAVDVFDERLAGGETKALIGRPRLETSYRIKQVVQVIKRAAEEFGKGDPEFLAMVRRAMEEEAETVGRRFGARMV